MSQLPSPKKWWSWDVSPELIISRAPSPFLLLHGRTLIALNLCFPLRSSSASALVSHIWRMSYVEIVSLNLSLAHIFLIAFSPFPHKCSHNLNASAIVDYCTYNMPDAIAFELCPHTAGAKCRPQFSKFGFKYLYVLFNLCASPYK